MSPLSHTERHTHIAVDSEEAVNKHSTCFLLLSLTKRIRLGEKTSTGNGQREETDYVLMFNPAGDGVSNSALGSEEESSKTTNRLMLHVSTQPFLIYWTAWFSYDFLTSTFGRGQLKADSHFSFTPTPWLSKGVGYFHTAILNVTLCAVNRSAASHKA